jgi:hypothetical protein
MPRDFSAENALIYFLIRAKASENARGTSEFRPKHKSRDAVKYPAASDIRREPLKLPGHSLPPVVLLSISEKIGSKISGN